ncbi:TetR/AcrR family transcriptional regulator [filamentous cyanobacterium LEGE 11480]|uniref:TetR/AcrR family transcriptional regulator n=1 Tax=Romeriopsis navalis LEGE 11480 TaxID=2777977 RepID=A0A928Z1P8_9CYAN|nr:TetR/AcrR family transcriptional regulator [Romeriopsis navalis]MBE9028232.1 TetR/AcrR family transcriptional regulator [Romeriopsis navalis LEGE 11480]
MPRTNSTNSDRSLSIAKSAMILQGAMQEFLEHGYAGTSMDRVAAAAGVSKATVYSHFGDKAGLFAAMVQHLADAKFSTVFAVAHDDPDVRSALHKMANTSINEMIGNKSFRRFIRLVYGESGRFPQLGQIFVEQYHKPGIEKLTDFLTAHPQLDLPDPEATARIIVGAMVHFMHIQHLLHGEEIMPMENDRFLTVLLNMIPVI